MSAPVTGVLVMAYGSPERLEDVEAYYTHIRRGRKPSPEQLQDLIDRYKAIGGSRLNPLTEAVARGIQERVNLPTYVGMKHWHPYIQDTVDKMAADGIRRAVALVLTPQYSRMSVGEYLAAARERAGQHGIELIEVEFWWDEPGYISFMAERVRKALAAFPEEERARVHVVYTAHSLPERIKRWNDPYPHQLEETARAVSRAAAVSNWHFAYQSASETGEPWLGPDILDKLVELKGAGVRGVVVSPVGFVCDHLEVCYDIDVEAVAKAKELGMRLVRTESPNDHPEFVDMLAGIVRRCAGQGAEA